MNKHIAPFLFFLFIGLNAFSQTYSVSGKVLDIKDNAPLIGVNVLLINPLDSARNKGTSTDMDGSFRLDGVMNGEYLLNISYVSYKSVEKRLTVNNVPVELGNLMLSEDSKLLKEVVVEAKQIRVQQMGDTSQFNADAFKVNKDANTEDLLIKMPGMTSDNGTVKVNGEEIKKILVNGKPFFGDDPRAAIQNLPAEIIDKIQVFDRMSDQAAFTGFDDGNSQKTINILTKNGLAASKLGKFYAGYGGPGNRFNIGLNVNAFKGDRRVSLLAMSNNINQQNFNIQDLVGATGSSGNRGGGGGGPGRMGRNSPVNNFLVGQQNGISTTTALGLNYADKIGKQKKVTISGSYFFNATLNDNSSTSTRNYISSSDSGLVYDETKETTSRNFNNRLNMRVEYAIDSNNTLIVTPSLSTQNNKSTTDLNASNTKNTESVSSTSTDQTLRQTGINFSNDILYQHKFVKKGRTISVNLTTSVNTRKSAADLFTMNTSMPDSIMLTDSIDQKAVVKSTGYTISGSMVYTEPVKKFGQLSITYTPSFTRSNSVRNTNNLDTLTGTYTDLDSVLSNSFTNQYITNKLGIAYRYNNKKINWTIGVSGQNALLRSEQTFPAILSIRKSFWSVLPNVEFNYKLSKTDNLRFFYRTSTNPPSITQLQDVIDNSNSLILSTGNPDLKQTFTQNIGLRMGRTNTDKATNLFVFVNASNTLQYIANSTTVFQRDTVLNNLSAAAGAQLIRPVNLNGYWNFRTFITYGFPITKIKSNMNINGGFVYTRTPALINDVRNNANTYALNAGFALSSNISKKIDFTISYNGNYSFVRNSLQRQNNSNYFTHIASAKINYQFWKGFVFNTSVTHNLNTGGSASFNTSFWLLNASLAYKFLKDESLEVKFSANDMLNQNRNITRNVTEVYTEDVRSNALQRYFMGTITYTLKKTGAAAKAEDAKPKDFMLTPPPGGMPPPPPGN